MSRRIPPLIRCMLRRDTASNRSNERVSPTRKKRCPLCRPLTTEYCRIGFVETSLQLSWLSVNDKAKRWQSDPDLARETIESIAARGTLWASAKLKEALKDRIINEPSGKPLNGWHVSGGPGSRDVTAPGAVGRPRCCDPRLSR